MANDRLLLRCIGCRKTTMLYKFYPDFPGVSGPYPIDEQDGTRIALFIYEHLGESGANHRMSLGAAPLFDLVHENVTVEVP